MRNQLVPQMKMLISALVIIGVLLSINFWVEKKSQDVWEQQTAIPQYDILVHKITTPSPKAVSLRIDPTDDPLAPRRKDPPTINEPTPNKVTFSEHKTYELADDTDLLIQ